MKITLLAMCFLTLFSSSSLLFADQKAESGIISRINARGNESGQKGFVQIFMPTGNDYILADASNQYNKIVYAAILSAYINQIPVSVYTVDGTIKTDITAITFPSW